MRAQRRRYLVEWGVMAEYAVVPLDTFALALEEGEVVQGYRTPHPSDHQNFYRGFTRQLEARLERELGPVLPGTFGGYW